MNLDANMVVAILGQDSLRLWLVFSIWRELLFTMVCVSCFSGTHWFNWEPFLCSFIGISSMIGLVGFDRTRRPRTPPRRLANERQSDTRQPLPRLISTKSIPPSNRSSFFRWWRFEPYNKSEKITFTYGIKHCSHPQTITTTTTTTTSGIYISTIILF